MQVDVQDPTGYIETVMPSRKPTPYDAGLAAARALIPVSANPYRAHKQRAEWHRGRLAGEDPGEFAFYRRRAEWAVMRWLSVSAALRTLQELFPRLAADLTVSDLHTFDPPPMDLATYGGEHVCAACGCDWRYTPIDCCANTPREFILPVLRRFYFGLMFTCPSPLDLVGGQAICRGIPCAPEVLAAIDQDPEPHRQRRACSSLSVRLAVNTTLRQVQHEHLTAT